MILAVISTGLFATAGFYDDEAKIKTVSDFSGSYVYYKDNSFNRTSYIGILFYNPQAYQIRYYAPSDDEQKLSEKDISLLISVNASSPYWDITGERIINTIIPDSEDIAIINYLHDILYEFFARRYKMGFRSEVDFSAIQDYEQFGGNVTIVFNQIVPIFNIRDIISENGTKVLECVTFGQVTTNEDKSFNNFKGLPQIPAQNNKIKASKIKKNGKQVINYNNTILALDKNWTQAMENCYAFGDNALVTIMTAQTESEVSEMQQIENLRNLLIGPGFYTDFANCSVYYHIKKGQFYILSKIYEPQAATYTTIDKIYSHKDNNSYLLTVAAKQTFYEENKSYFTAIMDSFKFGVK